MNPTWEKLLKRDKKGQYPREEIDQILADPAPELRAHWLTVLKEVATQGKKAKASSRNQAAYACLFLGELKITEAFEDLLKLFELPDSVSDSIFGDFFYETLPWALYRCSEGQDESLFQVASDPTRRGMVVSTAHEILTARRLSGALPPNTYITWTNKLLEAHATARNSPSLTEVLWNYAEVRDDFDETRARGWFERKLTDSTVGTWADLEETVLNQKETESSSSDIQKLMNDTLHDRTRIWSIRSEEPGQERDWEALLENLNSDGKIEDWLRPILGLSQESAVPEPIIRFIQQYSRDKQSHPDEVMSDPLLIRYSLGLLLAPGRDPFQRLLVHLSPLYQNLPKNGVRERIALAERYWNALVERQKSFFHALCRSDIIQDASGAGWSMVLHRFIEDFQVFSEGLDHGGFFVFEFSSLEQERRLNWIFDELEVWERLHHRFVKSATSGPKSQHWDSAPSQATLKVLHEIQTRLCAFETQWQARWEESLKTFQDYRADISTQLLATSRTSTQALAPTPSVSTFSSFPGAPIDNVIPFRRTTPKVGRNDSCPCGSGKKHKHCCGNAIE